MDAWVCHRLNFELTSFNEIKGSTKNWDLEDPCPIMDVEVDATGAVGTARLAGDRDLVIVQSHEFI